MKIQKKHILLTLLAIFSCCILAACGGEDPHVTAVKEGSPYDYPNQTYGEEFEDFFASPSWEYFEGSTEDSDEVSDVVEFTGRCTYQGVEVDVLIQFTLDMDDGSFEMTYLAFNDVPQDMIMMAGLMEAVFTD